MTSSLNRWQRFEKLQSSSLEFSNKPRPLDPSTVTDVEEALHWRKTVIQDAQQLIQAIQQPGLPDSEYRDMNDDINMYLKDKMKWEKQILSLGGTIPGVQQSLSSLSTDRKHIKYTYQYFGQAKNLPEVKKHLEKLERQKILKNRYNLLEMYKYVTSNYLGLDPEDPEMLAQEKETESRLRAQFIQSLEQSQK